MHRRFSSQHRHTKGRKQNVRRQAVRQLTFDSLEDRRLLAGLNVFVYDDANGSGLWETSAESSLTQQVVYVDNNDDGRLGADESYGITDADGKAFLDNLATGIAILRLLGSTSPGTPILVDHSNVPPDVNLPSKAAIGNTAPVLGNIPSQSIDEDLSLQLGRDLFDSQTSDADGDPTWLFIVGRPSNGTLVWSVEAGGVYQPNENFHGTDSIQIRAFDGKSWSSDVTLELTINSIDDLPTAIEFDGGSIPENESGFVIGPIQIIDVDGGPNLIRIVPEDLFEIQNGKLKLSDAVAMNFEEQASSNLTIQVVVGDSDSATLSQAFALPVADRNDVPSTLEFQGQLRIEEFIAGFEFGSVQVIDEDIADQYDFHVSDNRFEVVDGKLFLKAGQYLVFADAPTVSVTITATSRTTSDTISETLQIEVVRAAPPWQNKHWALDVNDDGELTPLDVLTVINALNRMGAVPLERLPTGSSIFVDVNGDRFLTPLDALILINALNRQSRGTSEGSGGSGGSNNSGQGAGEGEGEGSVPSVPRQLPQQLVGQFQSVDSASMIVDHQMDSAAVDDENISSPSIRRNARRVR